MNTRENLRAHLSRFVNLESDLTPAVQQFVQGQITQYLCECIDTLSTSIVQLDANNRALARELDEMTDRVRSLLEQMAADAFNPREHIK